MQRSDGLVRLDHVGRGERLGNLFNGWKDFANNVVEIRLEISAFCFVNLYLFVCVCVSESRGVSVRYTCLRAWHSYCDSQSDCRPLLSRITNQRATIFVGIAICLCLCWWEFLSLDLRMRYAQHDRVIIGMANGGLSKTRVRTNKQTDRQTDRHHAWSLH